MGICLDDVSMPMELDDTMIFSMTEMMEEQAIFFCRKVLNVKSPI